MAGPETRIQREIQEMVRRRGGFVFKVHGSETMMAGLPDLTIVYRGVPVYMEVKTPTGKLSTRQRYIIRKLVKAGAVVGVPTSVTHASAILDRVDAAVNAREAIVKRHGLNHALREVSGILEP